MEQKTFFLVVEGIDGSGKSTITRELIEAMKVTFQDRVKLTFEPHDPSCCGVFIRQVLMKKIRDVPLRTLALAFAANRSDHCNREINPFLEKANGKPRIVVCDRYYLSSLVYQSDNEFGMSEVMDINSAARRPDLILFMNASDRTCYKRMRHRNEDKELFETKLSDTREKYHRAISFLKERGENVVELQADGDLAEVRMEVFKAIQENSPDWLSFNSLPLPMEIAQDAYSPFDISISSVANDVFRSVELGAILSEKDLKHRLNNMETKVHRSIWDLTYERCASLFLNSLERLGFEVGEQLPWTDMDAFDVSCELPLGIKQSGSALLLGSSQKYDVIFKKMLSSSRFEMLNRSSDFLFVFDSNPSHLLTHHYEREILHNGETISLSPNVVVIDRQKLSDLVLKDVLNMFADEYINTLLAFPEWKKAVLDFQEKI